MLALQRRSGQRIRILDTATGEAIWVAVFATTDGGYRVAIDASRRYDITREEVLWKERKE